MDSYNRKKIRMDGTSSDNVSTSVPPFYMHSVPYTSSVFPGGSVTSAYNFSADNPYSNAATHSSLNVTKMNLGNSLRDVRQVDLSISKPFHSGNSHCPPLTLNNSLAAADIVGNSLDLSRPCLEDVLNSPPSFSSETLPTASLLTGTGRCAYIQPSTSVGSEALFYNQEAASALVLKIDPRTNQTSAMDFRGDDRQMKVVSRKRNDKSEMQVSEIDLEDRQAPADAGKMIYRCGMCGKMFISNEILRSHLTIHNDHMPYCCGICGAAFFDCSLLAKHVQSTHSVKDPYQCGICFAAFSDNHDYLEHMKACDDLYNGSGRNKVKSLMLRNTNINFCDNNDEQCSSGCESNSGATLSKGVDGSNISNDVSTILVGASGDFSMRKKRTKIVMEDVDIDSVCTIIVEPSTAGGERKKHVYKCKFCDKLCKDRGQIVSHVRVHTKVRPYECSVCFMKFKQYGHLRDHMMRHTKERPYVCDRCAKTFPRSSHLSEHIRLRHTEDRLYHCPDCLETFQKRKDFSKHKRSHGRKAKYQCSICSKKFFNVTDFERHCRSHTKEKQFECEVCHMTFGLLANAKKHMKVHSKFKPHKCEVCGKAFHFSNDLKRHETTHLKRKPFPCKDCYKSFKTAALLKTHSRLHVKTEEDSTAGPFQCKTCKKRFKMQWVLARHEKIHLKKKPFPCGSCYKSFNSEGMLKKHTKIHINSEHQGGEGEKIDDKSQHEGTVKEKD